MDMNFVDINDQEKSHTFHVKSDNAEITQATKHLTLLMNL